MEVQKPRSRNKIIAAVVVIAILVVAGVAYFEVYVNKPAPVTLVVYGSVDATDMSRLISDFQGNYSWISVQYTEMTPPVAYTTVTADLAGNKPTADVLFITNSIMNLMKSKGLLASYNSSQVSNYPSSYYDHSGYWSAALLLPVVFSYNTQVYNAGNLPTLAGLANQSMKGKEVILDPTLGSTGTQYFLSLAPILGNQTWTAFMHQLATNAQPSPNSDTTAIAQGVASGQYEIGDFTYLHDVLRLQSQGANIGWFLPKMANGTSIPLMTVLESLGIVKGTPNMQAAQDFENFALSRNGQEIIGNSAVRIPAMPGVTAKYTLESVAPGAKIVLFPTAQVSSEASAWGTKFKVWGF